MCTILVHFINLLACVLVLLSTHVACVCHFVSLQHSGIVTSNSDCKCYSFTSQQALSYQLVSTASRVVTNRERWREREREHLRQTD